MLNREEEKESFEYTKDDIVFSAVHRIIFMAKTT